MINNPRGSKMEAFKSSVGSFRHKLHWSRLLISPPFLRWWGWQSTLQCYTTTEATAVVDAAATRPAGYKKSEPFTFANILQFFSKLLLLSNRVSNVLKMLLLRRPLSKEMQDSFDPSFFKRDATNKKQLIDNLKTYCLLRSPLKENSLRCIFLTDRYFHFSKVQNPFQSFKTLFVSGFSLRTIYSIRKSWQKPSSYTICH